MSIENKFLNLLTQMVVNSKKNLDKTIRLIHIVLQSELV